jgi:hypothetical protein
MIVLVIVPFEMAKMTGNGLGSTLWTPFLDLLAWANNLDPIRESKNFKSFLYFQILQQCGSRDVEVEAETSTSPTECECFPEAAPEGIASDDVQKRTSN